MITKALLYCTLNQSALFYSVLDRKYMIGKDKPNDRFSNRLNGHVVAVCDIEVGEIKKHYGYALSTAGYHSFVDRFYSDADLERASCLDWNELTMYLKGDKENEKVGYAIHIKNLKVFDEPFKLGGVVDTELGQFWFRCNKAPQNMCRCRFLSKENTVSGFLLEYQDCVVISIQPQWLVKILNGEKTIEVRKKVLRDMLNEKK